MHRILKLSTTLCAFALAASAAAHAQFYKLHNADVGGAVTGQFTTQLTNNDSSVTNRTLNSVGGLFTLRDHPVSWAGVEFNYGYHRFSERYQGNNYSADVKTNMHEATAAYLFHGHYRNLQPYVAIGGGAIDFLPAGAGRNQWRGTGLLEAGLDIPTSNPHFGFRVQGRTLVYRAPNFGQPNLASRQWVATSEPSFGTWLRF